MVGLVFSGFASVIGISILVRAVLSFGATALIEAGLFAAGFIVGKLLKRLG